MKNLIFFLFFPLSSPKLSPSHLKRYLYKSMKQDGRDSTNSIEHCASNRWKENTIDVAPESPDMVVIVVHKRL